MPDSVAEPVDRDESAGGRLCLGERAAETRRRVGPVAWAVLEVLAASAAPAQEEDERVAELNVRAVAVALGLSKDTVAAALARLIADGLVRREAARRSARFAGSRYLLVVDVGLGECRGLSCPDAAGTTASDGPDHSEPASEQPKLDHSPVPVRVEPLRLFD